MQSQSPIFRWASTPLLSYFILVLLIWSCSASSRVDHQQLFKQYFSPTENDWIKTNAGQAAQRLQEQAFRLYDEQRYDQALILFDELLKGQRDPNLLFFTGNTLLVLGQYQNALRIFQEVPEGHDRFVASQWYAGLASMQLEQIAQAKLHLERVANSEENGYRTKARQLLQLLE